MRRRQFLRNTMLTAGGALGFPTLIPGSALGKTELVPPSERITLGLVGLGKQMQYLIGRFLQLPDIQIVAICDVESQRMEIDRSILEKLYTKWLGRDYRAIDTTGDFRDIAARTDIDAVVIATPDHWHALTSVAMLEAGKDVYCEKPLSLTIAEGQAMVAATRRHGRVFQTGSMQRSAPEFRQACELVRNGVIGEVQEVYVSVGGPPQECYLPAEPVPAGLDWDMWLGPAPWRPYNSDLAPSLKGEGYPEDWNELAGWFGRYPNFRAYRDFAGGGMTDWGAHHFDIAQWGLGMDGSGPVRITPPDGGEHPYLTYEYANGVKMYHREEGWAGVTFIGPEGVVNVNRGRWETEPAELKDLRFGPNDVRLYASAGHYRDFVDAVKLRRRPLCDVAIGHSSATVCHLGNIAYELKRPLAWNPETEQFADDPAADRMLSRAMRSPWTL